MKTKQERIIEVVQFLKDFILECEPDTGCGRCDDLRKHINTLESIHSEPEDELREDSELADILKECRDTLILDSLIDKSNTTDKTLKRLEEYLKSKTKA
jgi:hypothetical protein